MLDSHVSTLGVRPQAKSRVATLDASTWFSIHRTCRTHLGCLRHRRRHARRISRACLWGLTLQRLRLGGQVVQKGCSSRCICRVHCLPNRLGTAQCPCPHFLQLQSSQCNVCNSKYRWQEDLQEVSGLHATGLSAVLRRLDATHQMRFVALACRYNSSWKEALACQWCCLLLSMSMQRLKQPP